jgi:two-component system sensor histidine kinase EvgS
MCATVKAGYLQVFGIEREAVIGRTVVEGVLSDADEAKGYHQDYLRVMAEGVRQVQDRRPSMPDGRVLTIYHWMLPYRCSDGAVSGMIAGWIDVSERLHLLQALRQAKRR